MPTGTLQYVYHSIALPGLINTTFNATSFASGVATTVTVLPRFIMVHGVVVLANSTGINNGRRLHQVTTPKLGVSFSIQSTSAPDVSAAISAAIFNDTLQSNLVSAGVTQLTGTIIATSSPQLTVTMPAALPGQVTLCPHCSPPPPPPLPPPPLALEDATERMEMGLGVGIGLGIPFLVGFAYFTHKRLTGGKESKDCGRVPCSEEKPQESKAAPV